MHTPSCYTPARVPSRHASTHLQSPPTANQSSSELAGCRRRADSGARGVRELQHSATQQYQLLRRGGDWPWATCSSTPARPRPSSRHWNVRVVKNSPRDRQACEALLYRQLCIAQEASLRRL